MESSESYESGTFRVFMTGALIGAGIALLFAPQAGGQLRGLLRDYMTRSTKELDGAVERGTTIVDNTLEAGHEFVEQGKESFLRQGRKKRGQSNKGRTRVTESVEPA